MNHLRIFLWIFALIHSADTSGYETGSAYPEDVSSDPTSGRFEYANTNNAQQQTGQQGVTMPRPSTFTHGRATESFGAEGSGRPTLQSLSSGTQFAAGQSPTFTSGTQPHPTYIGTHSIHFGNTRRQTEVAILADALSGLTPTGGTQPTNVGTASHPAAAAASDPRLSSMTTQPQQQQNVVLPPSTTITQHSSAGLPPLPPRTLTSPHVRLPTTRRTTNRLSPLGSGGSTMTQQWPSTAQNPTAPHPMMTSISTASHQSHQAAATQHIPTLSRSSQSQQRQQSSGHHRQTFHPISHPSAPGAETGKSSSAHQSAGGFARPTSSNEMRRSVSAPHRVGPSTAGSSLATAPRISAGIRSASTRSSSGNPPISSLSDSERIRLRTKNTLATGAPLLNAYHSNLNQYGAPQGKTKKLLQSLSNLQGDAYSVSEASQKILHYGNDAHYELLQYQGQLDREKSERKLNEQQYNERLQTAKDAMKYLTKLREASAEYKTLRENRPANE